MTEYKIFKVTSNLNLNPGHGTVEASSPEQAIKKYKGWGKWSKTTRLKTGDYVAIPDSSYHKLKRTDE